MQIVGTSLLLALLVTLVDGESLDYRMTCPTSWVAYKKTIPWECLFMSERGHDVGNYSLAQNVCQEKGGHLVTIFTEEKYQFVADLLTANNRRTTWIGLRRNKKEWDATWDTPEGRKEMTFQATPFYRRLPYGCVGMTSGGTWEMHSDCEKYQSYVCERKAECNPDWYGHQCEIPCRCHGLVCDKVNGFNWYPKCPYGCKQGWMGERCDQKKEKASVGYHCVNVPEGDKYAMIVINRKGADYNVIEPIDDTNTPMQWCNGTNVTTDKASSQTLIKINMNDDAAMQDMGKICAGKHLKTGECQWRIRIKEWEGIDLPLDQIVQVTCNFKDGENLTRTGVAIATSEKAEDFSRLKETKEGLVLELADAGSKKKLSSAKLGEPVILQVRYGFTPGSLVKKVIPYDCEAVNADKSKRLQLLDSNGCQADESPVKPFLEAGRTATTVATPWFPYFTFGDKTSVYYTCSFHLCYDDTCRLGCNQNRKNRQRRHVRTSRRTKAVILV